MNRAQDVGRALLDMPNRLENRVPAGTQPACASVQTAPGAPFDPMSQCLLKLQIGPVQDFIAQARSTRDLWSGSYLLSWLMAAGLGRFSNLGDFVEVIYPSVQDQPLVQLHRQAGERPSANEYDCTKEDQKLAGRLVTNDPMVLSIPSLPNIVLAILRSDKAVEIAKDLETAIRDEWHRIGRSTWQSVETAGLADDEDALSKAQRKQRFFEQMDRFLSVSWMLTPVTDNEVNCQWQQISRNNSWQLDAVRQTRGFQARKSGGWAVGTWENKDSLNGREEAVAGGPETQSEWQCRCRALGGPWTVLFKHSDWLGATTLVKRIWHVAYLKTVWGLDSPKMPNTHGLALHRPMEDSSEQQADIGQEDPQYFAVLTMDGDRMGEWSSGAKIEEILSRPATPADQRAFSKLLSSFALKCARRVVELFEGRIIYAGGDDVLALLPADSALPCAEALRLAFKGNRELVKRLKRQAEIRRNSTDVDVALALADQLFWIPDGLNQPPWGCLADQFDANRSPIAFSVPGEQVEVSAGIAIAHVKAPLQDVVLAAIQAERRAKRELDRSAVAVTLLKRGGEIIEWGCKWDSGGLRISQMLAAALDAAAVSDRLPFRIAGFAEGFLIEHTPLSARSIEPVEQFPAIDILLKVFSFALHQHVQNETSLAYQQLLGLCGTDSPLAHYLRQTERSTVLKAAKTLVGELIKLQPDARLNSTTKALQDLAERTTGSASELLVNLNELLDALSDSLLGSPVASPYILLKDRVLKGLKVEISQAASRALLGLCETLILCRRTAQQRNIVERQIS